MTKRIQDSFVIVRVDTHKPKLSKLSPRAKRVVMQDMRERGGDPTASDTTESIKMFDSADIRRVWAPVASFVTWHDSVTAPYLGGRGLKLLNVKLQQEHSNRAYDARIALQANVREFARRYVDVLAKRQAQLGDYFDPSDYVAPEHIQHAFEFNFTYMPVPNSRDFQLGQFVNEQAASLKAQLDAATQRAADNATREYRDKLLAKLKRASEQMRNGERLFDSLAGNLEQLLIADMNVSGDSGMTAAQAELKAIALPKLKKALKSKSEDSRTDAAEALDAITAKLKGIGTL